MLTPDRARAILDAVSAGNSFLTAATYAGIGERTLYQWVDKGKAWFERHEWDEDADVPADHEDPQARYAAFAQALYRARAQAEVRAVATIVEAGSDRYRTDQDGRRELVEAGDWRAAAWYLERSRPDRWAKRIRVDEEREVAESVAAKLESFVRRTRGELGDGIIDAVVVDDDEEDEADDEQ